MHNKLILCVALLWATVAHGAPADMAGFDSMVWPRNVAAENAEATQVQEEVALPEATEAVPDTTLVDTGALQESVQDLSSSAIKNALNIQNTLNKLLEDGTIDISDANKIAQATFDEMMNTLKKSENVLKTTADGVNEQTRVALENMMGNMGDLGNMANLGDMSNIMGNLGNFGNFGNMGDMMGNFGNLGDLGNLGNMGNFGNLGDLGNLGNMGNFGNLGDLSNLGNMGNFGNLGDLGNLGNMGNLGDLGNFGIDPEAFSGSSSAVSDMTSQIVKGSMSLAQSLTDTFRNIADGALKSLSNITPADDTTSVPIVE